MDGLDQWGFAAQRVGLEGDFYFSSCGEEITEYRRRQDPGELLAALKQKEEELVLAAELGNALLLDNTQLKEQADGLHRHYAQDLEELEQGRHDLRLKLESCQSQWESQVGDLERDVRELGARAERLTQALGEAQREKSQAEQEHMEQKQLLHEQLDTAMEVEKVMSTELQALKQELRQRGTHSRAQEEELISAMKEQVVRLTQKEQALEQRLHSTSQENLELRESLDSVRSRLAVQDQRGQQQNQQLTEARGEAEAARGRARQLQARVEELQEEASFQEARSHGDTSLLAELEGSLDSVGLGLSQEQVRQDVQSVLQMLLPLTRERNLTEGSDSVEWQEDLQAVLLRLKGVARNLAHTCCPQELNPAFVDSMSDPCGNPSAAQDLKDQNLQLLQQNAELSQELQCRQEQVEAVQQAIRDRDEAIAKKNLMEAELVRSKTDMMSLNNQLLEAIQRKLELSQELEAWQDDIQIILNQQLRSQQQLEQLQRKPHSNGMSFSQRSSPNSSAWTHQPSLASSWSTETNQDKAQTPWRDWLRRGKWAHHRK